MGNYKKVLLEISVPKGDYCMDDGLCCGKLSRHNVPANLYYCSLHLFSGVYSDKFDRIEKPLTCKNLKEITNENN